VLKRFSPALVVCAVTATVPSPNALPARLGGVQAQEPHQASFAAVGLYYLGGDNFTPMLGRAVAGGQVVVGGRIFRGAGRGSTGLMVSSITAGTPTLSGVAAAITYSHRGVRTPVPKDR